MTNRQKKIVIFGAGKIGRSFIGQVFSRGEYELVFVDIDQQLIDLLNSKKRYKVIIKSNSEDTRIYVSPVRGLRLDQSREILDELSSASLAALSVGQNGLPSVIPVLAYALKQRKESPESTPLDIIIAENMRDSDSYIFSELKKLLPSEFPLRGMAGLVETSIGKMVPFMTEQDLKDDPLQVFAEPYNSLIVSKNAFKNQIPDIEDLSPKENIKAWVDRKLFIHNLGHAAAAYLGYLHNPEMTFIYEALNNEEIRIVTRETMLQSADILMALHPGEFTHDQLEDHIDDLLSRFRNKELGDTIFRVGCDLYRKLGQHDRLSAPIHAAIRLKLPYNLLMNALVAGISFRATDEHGKHHPSDLIFFEEANKGVDHVLKSICKLA